MPEFGNNEERFLGGAGEYKFTINGKTVSPEEYQRVIQEREKEKLNNSLKKYMPIGSVVTLKNSSNLLMILGFNYLGNNQVYDYISCIYPFGFNSHDSTILFNHDQIDKIYYIGYSNEQERAFKSELNSNSGFPRQQ